MHLGVHTACREVKAAVNDRLALPSFSPFRVVSPLNFTALNNAHDECRLPPPIGPIILPPHSNVLMSPTAETTKRKELPLSGVGEKAASAAAVASPSLSLSLLSPPPKLPTFIPSERASLKRRGEESEVFSAASFPVRSPTATDTTTFFLFWWVVVVRS